jgi:phage terminase small subunit
VNEYLIDLNAKQAAIRAGYSAKTAEQQGSRLLSNVKVSAAIQAGKETLARSTAIAAERVIASPSGTSAGCSTPRATWCRSRSSTTTPLPASPRPRC